MAKTPTPIEVMAKAYYEEQIDGFGCDYPEMEEEARANRERCMRAALRALAEMEPTEERCYWPYRVASTQAGMALDGKWAKISGMISQAYILAAANEGEQQ